MPLQQQLTAAQRFMFGGAQQLPLSSPAQANANVEAALEGVLNLPLGPNSPAALPVLQHLCRALHPRLPTIITATTWLRLQELCLQGQTHASLAHSHSLIPCTSDDITLHSICMYGGSASCVCGRVGNPSMLKFWNVSCCPAAGTYVMGDTARAAQPATASHRGSEAPLRRSKRRRAPHNALRQQVMIGARHPSVYVTTRGHVGFAAGPPFQNNSAMSALCAGFPGAV